MVAHPHPDDRLALVEREFEGIELAQLETRAALLFGTGTHAAKCKLHALEALARGKLTRLLNAPWDWVPLLT